MAIVRRIWELIVSPNLYQQYGQVEPQTVYAPNRLERWGEQVIHSLSTAWTVTLYTSPIVATILYRRGYFAFEGLFVLSKVLVGIGIILSFSYCLRAVGRMNNPVYVQFNDVLSDARTNLTKDKKKKLMKYDFQFSAWPVEFNVSGDRRSLVSAGRQSARQSALDSVISIPCKLASYIAAKTLALKLIYPGSVRMLQYIMFNVIQQGREKLIEEYNAERFKIRSRDDNDIDVIFVDRRQAGGNGRTLVICCEGNCGFYELGIMMTPIEARYSVVGWNHPGFGGSTGAPYPDQEQNAIDAVMQFAIQSLGFMPDNILLFGWSIGGYTSTWAAMNYPDVKGLILDATFDDILPLAIPRMPRALEPLVRRLIREHVNLNVFEQAVKYPGPVLFIRRGEDEIICTDEGVLSTNRGNHLVAKILKFRFPKVFDDRRQILLNEWLAADYLQQALMYDKLHIDKDLCQSMLVSYIEDNSTSYPMLIGDGLTDEQKANLALFLADKYLTTFRATHCAPLPVNLFREPWAPITTESSFVKV